LNPPFLFNRNSNLSDFCTKILIETKPTHPLHYHIVSPLFAFFCFFIACFWSADYLESRA
jgi:hypothetical protein